MICSTLTTTISAAGRGHASSRRSAIAASRRHIHVARPTPPEVVRAPGAPRRARVACAAEPSTSAAAPTAERVSRLTDELRVLETERDEAVKTAESCARTSVRLEEMVSLLDKLALEKMKDGDEDGARQVLTEKASTKEVLEKTNTRAQVNYTLASKLADKIGSVQRQLVELLSPAGTGAAGAAAAAAPEPRQEQQQPPASSGGGGGSGSDFASSYAPRRPEWESSLEAARERIRRAEEAAASDGRRAASDGARAARAARESIEEARERLRRQAVEGVAEAQARLRAQTRESIAEARARIAREDEAVLAKVQALMARYRRGEYVSEDELEWAFRTLENRFVM